MFFFIFSFFWIKQRKHYWTRSILLFVVHVAYPHNVIKVASSLALSNNNNNNDGSRSFTTKQRSSTELSSDTSAYTSTACVSATPRLESSMTYCKGGIEEQEELSDRRDFLIHSVSSAMGILSLGYCYEAASASSTFPMTSMSSTVSPPAEDSNNKNKADTQDTSSNVKWREILDQSTKRALSGGKAGASAAVIQVLSLMWLRTTMNYQYRYGGTFQEALYKLYYEEGGISRLYQGLPFALIQGPLTRFGDTAANAGMLALLSSLDTKVPLIVTTAAGSVAAGLWRIVCMPIDTSKTAMQVEGSQGLRNLYSILLETKSLTPLYQGAVASAAATAVGHFPVRKTTFKTSFTIFYFFFKNFFFFSFFLSTCFSITGYFLICFLLF